MSGPPLSPATAVCLAALFTGHQRDEAEQLLLEDCGLNLPAVSSETGIERVRFAALKCSEGTLEGLVNAIALAQLDWRDLLIAADFAEPGAHLDWLPNKAPIPRRPA